MFCLPIPGTEVAGDPGCLGKTFDCKDGTTILSGGPLRAEVSLCRLGDAGTTDFAESCLGVTGGGGEAFLWAVVLWRISDKNMCILNLTSSIISKRLVELH